MAPEISPWTLGALGAGSLIGTVIAVPIFQFLLKKYFSDQERRFEKIEKEVKEAGEKQAKEIAEEKERFVAAISSGNAKIGSLREHVDMELTTFRGNYHDQMGKLNVMLGRMDERMTSMERAVNMALQSNKETLEWAGQKFEAMTDVIGALKVTMGEFNATLRQMRRRSDPPVDIDGRRTDE